MSESSKYEILSGQTAKSLNSEGLAIAKALCVRLFVESANMLNDWQPITERGLCKELKDTYNFSISPSAVHCWRVEGKWDDQVKAAVALAISDEPSLQKALKCSTLKQAVKSTEISVERNKVLLSAGYELAEIELLDLLIKRKQGSKPLSKDEFWKFLSLTKLFAERDDRMLDRLAMMAANAVDANEVLNKLEAIEVEIED